MTKEGGGFDILFGLHIKTMGELKAIFADMLNISQR